MKKILAFATGTVLVCTLPAAALASEVSGTLTTGLQSGLEGKIAATPAASPSAGVFSSAQSVTLTATDSDSIRYTTDGTTPTCATGTLYSGAISVSASLTIRAVACYGSATSAVGIFAYGISLPSPPSGGGGGGGPAPSSGDLNGDSHVDLIDFNLLLVAWGSTGPSLGADFNRDGVVDLLDFNQLIINWTG